MKLPSTNPRSIVFAAVLGCAAGQSLAADNEGMRPDRRGPPPEALAACESASAGDSCSFQSPRGEATGQCITLPKGKSLLACKPASH